MRSGALALLLFLRARGKAVGDLTREEFRLFRRELGAKGGSTVAKRLAGARAYVRAKIRSGLVREEVLAWKAASEPSPAAGLAFLSRAVEEVEQLLRSLPETTLGRRERLLPLGTKAKEAPLEYLEVSRPELARGETEALFLSGSGRRLSAHGLMVRLRKLGERLGLKVRPHLLRHSCATPLLRGRADIRHIQQQLGHKSLRTTERNTRVETRGGGLRSQGLAGVVRGAARHAGIELRVSPHRIRHSYATHLLRHGAPLLALKALLGHASPVSTEVYLAVEPIDLARMLQQSHPRERGGTISPQ